MIARVDAADSLLLIVDVQSGHLDGLRTTSTAAIVRTIESLCSGATAHEVPIVVAAAELHGRRSPLASAFGGSEPIWHSSADALHEPDLVGAVSATERRTLLVAGVAIDVGVMLTALSAREAGYRTFVVLDACGANDSRAESAAVARLCAADIVITSAAAVLAEWQVDFELPRGEETLRLMGALSA